MRRHCGTYTTTTTTVTGRRWERRRRSVTSVGGGEIGCRNVRCVFTGRPPNGLSRRRPLYNIITQYYILLSGKHARNVLFNWIARGPLRRTSSTDRSSSFIRLGEERQRSNISVPFYAHAGRKRRRHARDDDTRRRVSHVSGGGGRRRPPLTDVVADNDATVVAANAIFRLEYRPNRRGNLLTFNYCRSQNPEAADARLVQTFNEIIIKARSVNFRRISMCFN